MKITFSSLLIFFALHLQAQQTRNGSIGITVVEHEQDWPKDVQGLIDHLNEWDKNGLDAYERPKAYPNFVTSGETNAWIRQHVEQLLKLDAMIVWNKKKMKYELTDSNRVTGH